MLKHTHSLSVLYKWHSEEGCHFLYFVAEDGVIVLINPARDGIEHINVYSKGATDLGRMLSNFSKFPIRTKDGNFMSVEGYWYWLSIEPCVEREQLRGCYGFWAKKTGEEILEAKQALFDKDFEHKILLAIWYKFRRNSHLIFPEHRELPFYHYYNYGGNVIDVTDKYFWMIDGITKMRDSLVSTTNGTFIDRR